MTRMLSELLGAREPTFRLNVRELERASGDPSADIRLSTEIMQNVQTKLQELGLDPTSTTGEELYAALRQRLLADEQRLRDYFQVGDEATTTDILAKVHKFVHDIEVPRSCFALKMSVAKRLLEAVPPKKAMKHLGYRSLASMLKHEPVPQLYTATLLYESAHWHKELMDKYNHLQPNDFESRQISILYPTSKRWEALAEDFALARHHTSVAFKELGAIVMLPVEANLPALALTSLLLLLESVNDIRCSSTFLKLQQVKPDFGKLVVQVVSGETYASARLAGRPLPWRLLQRYYGSKPDIYHPAIFEPHIQSEDLKLVKAEEALAKQLPTLEFWLDTPELALVDHGQAVSFNMLDVALSTANKLSFEERIIQHVRSNVWEALLTRYLNPYNLNQVVRQLSDELVEAPPELATETVPSESMALAEEIEIA